MLLLSHELSLANLFMILQGDTVAVREIIRMGNPLLRERSRELTKDEILSDWFKNLIVDMTDSMHATNGVGIAAPQLGELVRLSVIEFSSDNVRYPEMGAQGLTIFVNPVLRVTEPKEQTFWEGCLSVPDLRGAVARPSGVYVEYLNEKAELKQLQADGFLATVLQHEFDHLDGVLYIDRIKDLKKLSYIEEYKQFWSPQALHEELDD